MSRKLASASWSLLALASIGGAAQGHHVIFHAKGGDPPARSTLGGYIASQEAMDQYQSTGSEANHRRKMDATDSACFGP